jgi:hypothetical protein
MDVFDYVGVESFQHIKNFLNTHVAKAPRQEKGNHHIVESTQLNTMCVTYNRHILIYNKDKTKVTQLK